MTNQREKRRGGNNFQRQRQQQKQKQKQKEIPIQRPHQGTTRNRVAVLMNNAGVSELKEGHMSTAFEILSKAAKLTAHADVHVDDKNHIYEYEWVECANANSPRCYHHRRVAGSRKQEQQEQQKQCYNEGMSSFLCLRALKIQVQDDYLTLLDDLCPCGYAWVVWYNLALTCSIMGTRLGVKGHRLLEQANGLFKLVQVRIDAARPANHWLLLQLAITNNQAFIHRELAMSDATVARLLFQLAETLNSPVLNCGEQDWDLFYLNMLILNGQRLAGAA